MVVETSSGVLLLGLSFGSYWWLVVVVGTSSGWRWVY